MDALDRLAGGADDLLTRVDSTLAHAGAPEHHPVWPLLRRLGVLPGDAIRAFAAARAAPLAAAGSTLHRLADGYAHHSASLPATVHWHGAGAESFAAQWASLRTHLGADLLDRLRATESYVDSVESWLGNARDRLAGTLAAVMVSAEAVRVRTASALPDWRPEVAVPEIAVPPEVAMAAADIAVRVLQALAEVHERGEELLREWGPRLAEATYQAPAPVPPRPDLTTEVAL